MTNGDALIDRFGDETTQVVCRTLGAAWGSFYRLASGHRPFAFRSLGIPAEFGAAYAKQDMQHVDPLHPFRLVPRKHRFLTMGDARVQNPARHRDFLSFLRAYGGQDAAEMIFSYQGRAIAGLSIVWTERKPEHRALLELGNTLHSYIEFNLGAMWPGLGLAGATGGTAAECTFTGREKEVIDVVCRGLTNEQIAWHLNIGLATVKTHLIHIFKKAGVETRGELISRMLSTSQVWSQAAQPSG
jgi:DNA-binding CsgD family transcriptional regulator